MVSDFDFFVIGGGSGGVRAARTAAKYGAKTGIAEGRFWGGTCVNIGCVPKKLMVQAAEYGAFAEDSHGFGWDIEKRSFNRTFFLNAQNKEVARLNQAYRRLLTDSGVQLFDEKARFLSPNTLQVGEKTVSARHILIATGGTPVFPDIPGAEHGIVSDQIFSLRTQPEEIIIVGGGYIAVEFACIFNNLGTKVHLVHRSLRPLRGFDAELTEVLAASLKEAGIIMHPGVTPVELKKKGMQRDLLLSDGQTLSGKHVLWAVGRKPLVAELNLAEVHVKTGSRGEILTDPTFQTSQPGIYAVGDVRGGITLTPVALAEGQALAERLFANGPGTVAYNNIPSAVFTSPPLALVGLSEEEALLQTDIEVYTSSFTPMRHNLTGRKRKTFMKLVTEQRTGKVLGIHMFGEDAPEIIQGFAVALQAGASKADFDRTIGIHPTAAEELVTMRQPTRRLNKKTPG